MSLLLPTVVWIVDEPTDKSRVTLAALREHGWSVSVLHIDAAAIDTDADVMVLELCPEVRAQTSLHALDMPKLMLVPTNDALARELPNLGRWDDAALPGEPIELVIARLHRLWANYRRESVSESTDPLTDLANRTTADAWVRRAVSSVATETEALALVMLDIDHFKRINDQFGHAVGDQALQAVGRSMKTLLGPTDLCARHGGEEFLVLLRRAGPAELRAALQPLLQVTCPLPGVAGMESGSIELTLSAGVAMREPGLSQGEWLARADKALYESKAHGRHRLTFFEELLSRDDDGAHALQIRHFDNVTRVVTERVASLVSLMGQQMLKSMGREARQDPLTGVANRGQFDRRIAREVERAVREHHPLALLFLDIDDFGRFNREHGAPVGDAVLRQFARTIEGAIRAIDWLARYGGEEFCVVMPADADEALAAAERLRDTVEQASVARPGGQNLRVTVSIGVAQYAGVPETIDEWVQRASSAVQRAKRAGRNRVAVDGIASRCTD